jgi:N-hydroxyarylamine O-acetyltransferase
MTADGENNSGMLTTDEIARYLARISYFGSTEPTADVLADIQWAHLQAVPFEALDICPLGRPFSIEPEDVYRKVVLDRRGGYCFELNGLLGTLLESMGFGVERMSGLFTDAPEEEHDQFDHMTLHVTVPGNGSRWFVDVAAGRQNPDQPVPLNGESADGRFRTRPEGDLWHFEKSDGDGGWIPQMAWTTVPRTLDDFRGRDAYFQDDPDSDFRKGPLCTAMIPGGRLTLSKWTLITTVDGVRTEQNLSTSLEIQMILAEWFGIDLEIDHWWDGE